MALVSLNLILDIHNVLQTKLDGKAISFGSQHCKCPQCMLHAANT